MKLPTFARATVLLFLLAACASAGSDSTSAQGEVLSADRVPYTLDAAARVRQPHQLASGGFGFARGRLRPQVGDLGNQLPSVDASRCHLQTSAASHR
jgi:hypothetical protein